MRTSVLAVMTLGLLLTHTPAAIADDATLTLSALRKVPKYAREGVILGIIRSYRATFLRCPGVSASMVHATLDATPLQYEDVPIEAAVLSVLVRRLGCTMDMDWSPRSWGTASGGAR